MPLKKRLHFYLIFREREIQATDATWNHNIYCGYTRDGSSMIRCYCDFNPNFPCFSECDRCSFKRTYSVYRTFFFFTLAVSD